MSRILQPAQPTQVPVLPGTQVVTQMPMSTAVNAGDYVYLTASGYGVAASSGSAGTYTNLIGLNSVTGALATGSLPSFQYGPVQQATAYSGSTLTVGGTVVSQTQLAAVNSSSYPTLVTTLTNNNFVYFYSDGTNYVFKIVDDTGATIAGPTAIDAVGSFGGTPSYRTTSVFPTQDGGFLIAYAYYGIGSTIPVKKYTSTGTLSASYSVNITYGFYYYLTIMELSNGNIAITFADTNYAYYGVWTSTFSAVSAVRYIANDSNYYYISSGSYAYEACPLTGGGFVAVWYAANYGQWSVQYIDNTGSGYTNAPANIGTALSGSNSYRAWSMCPTPDGNFATAMANSSSQIVIARIQRNSTSSYSVYLASNTVASGGLSSTNTGPFIFPVQGNGLGAFYFYADAYPYIVYTSSSSITSTTLGTPVNITSNGVNVNTYGGITNGYYLTNSKGKTAIAYNNGSGGGYYPQLRILSSIAVTNGSLIYGTAFQPPNYLLQGVAVNTVASGGTASVVINGSAELNSNYPSLASTTSFDFSGTGQFGNVGSVYGRTVTLKGVQ